MQEFELPFTRGNIMDELKYLPKGGKINREGFWVGLLERQCTRCRSIFSISSSTVTLCNFCNSRRVKSTTPEFKMWQRSIVRAKKLGRVNTLVLSDINIPTTCPILGIPLVVHSGKSGGRPDSPALDRLDSSAGYTKENVWVISQRANQMKADADFEELKKFALWVLKTF
jgi:hypothetical protein